MSNTRVIATVGSLHISSRLWPRQWRISRCMQSARCFWQKTAWPFTSLANAGLDYRYPAGGYYNFTSLLDAEYWKFLDWLTAYCLFERFMTVIVFRYMKLLRFISVFLVLVLALSPVLASACAISCALGSTKGSQQTMSMDMSSMDANHCKFMQKSSGRHGKQTQHNNCTMAGCHFSVATTLDFGHTDFTFNHSSNQPVHFNSFGLSADRYPPIKPPAWFSA